MIRRLFLLGLALAAAVVAPLGHAVSVGQPAAALTLVDRHGELVTLDKLRGRVVYVDFWASWCGPCRQSFPIMNDLQQRYHARGLTVLGVNVDRSRGDADRFLRQVPARFPVVFDASGVTPQAWGVSAMPTGYLLDTQGRVVLVETGLDASRRAALEERIQALLPR